MRFVPLLCCLLLSACGSPPPETPAAARPRHVAATAKATAAAKASPPPVDRAQACRKLAARLASLPAVEPPAHPVSTLAPVPIPSQDGRIYPTGAGSRVIFAQMASDDIWSYAPGGGWTRIVQPPDLAENDFAKHRFVADGIVTLHPEDGTLWTLSATTGRLAWRVPLYEPKPNVFVSVEVVRDGDELVVLIDRIAHPHDVVRLRWSDGAEIWRRRLPTEGAEIATDEGRTFVYGVRDGVTRAFGSDGTPLWTHTQPPGKEERMAELHARHGALVLAYWRGDIEVLDGATGARCHHVPPLDAEAPRWPLASGVRLVGGNLYGVVRRHAAGDTFASVVFSVDLTSGRRRWQSKPFPYLNPARYSAGILATPHALYASLNDDTMRAFDLADGKLLWQWGLGASNVAPSTNPRVPFVARQPGDGNRFAAFALGGSPPPLWEVTITGRAQRTDGSPYADEPIVVHDTRVITDGAGRFRATVEARGGLMVHMRTPKYRVRGNSWVALRPGQIHYAVKLRLEPAPPCD